MFVDAKVFSKMDFQTGFHKIILKPEDVEKTGFNTKHCQLEYLVIPIGLCIATETFQSLINRFLCYCLDVFKVAYIDDLLLFSKDGESNLKHPSIVFLVSNIISCMHHL